MENKRISKRIVSFFLACLFIVGCDGPFPSTTKPNVPDDHTENIKGVFHKKGYEFPFKESSGCSETTCHQPDLDGGVADVDGRIAIAPSCFQCHETLWSDEE